MGFFVDLVGRGYPLLTAYLRRRRQAPIKAIRKRGDEFNIRQRISDPDSFVFYASVTLNIAVDPFFHSLPFPSVPFRSLRYA